MLLQNWEGVEIMSPSPNLYVEILTYNARVITSGACGMGLDHEGRVLTKGVVSALRVKVTPVWSLFPSAMWGHGEAAYQPGSGHPPDYLLAP